MTFGEYVLMYVFVWSDVLWREGPPEYLELPPESIPSAPGARRKRESEFAKDAVALARFRDSLPIVRKALANVPTYMIIDDHEVSDSTNLDKRWCRDVYGSALGVRIVTNATLAYALCQHWGNVPEQFEVGAGQELLQILGSGAVHTSTIETSSISTPSSTVDSNCFMTHRRRARRCTSVNRSTPTHSSITTRLSDRITSSR